MDMTQGKPGRLILGFALPLMLGNVFQQLYTFVDTQVVGQALGVNALAALGASEWLTFLMFGSVQGLTQGFSVIISQKFGAGQEGELRRAVFQAALLSAVAAVLLTGLGQAALPSAISCWIFCLCWFWKWEFPERRFPPFWHRCFPAFAVWSGSAGFPAFT